MSSIARFRAAARQVLRAPLGALLRARERFVLPRLQHELAVCAIFREEASFLAEWITFHRGVGATHFYLYDNGSTDDGRAALQPWIADGVVTLSDWPGSVRQLEAYRDCIRRARATCQWVAFIDVDEFLFSPQAQDLRPLLRSYRDLPGLVVWQAFFGSGGHRRRPQAPVTLTYLQRAPFGERTTVKTIANPRLVYKVGVHEFKFWGGEARDSSRHRVADQPGPVVDLLRINHYWSRSLEDLATKIARGDASIDQPRGEAWHYDFERTLNAERDETVVPVARAIFSQALRRPSR